MKRIWFVQQKPFNYMPLRAGLGLITAAELQEVSSMHELHDEIELCPKIYTSRKKPLKGEYYVVEGSRFKAKPVEPRIEFKVEQTWELNLSLEAIKFGSTLTNHTLLQKKEINDFIIQKMIESFDMLEDHTFPELDLGYKRATFNELKEVLLGCNKGTTINTPFHINRLEPIGVPQ